jgi:hypothetical protein
MMAFLLLVTWLAYNQPPDHYQVPFSSNEACEAARLQLIKDAERIGQSMIERASAQDFPSPLQSSLFPELGSCWVDASVALRTWSGSRRRSSAGDANGLHRAAESKLAASRGQANIRRMVASLCLNEARRDHLTCRLSRNHTVTCVPTSTTRSVGIWK